MSGYDSYKSRFPAPEYERIVLSQWDIPFNKWLRDKGVDPDTAQRGTKILDASGTSETYKTPEGGVIEAMWDELGNIIVLIVPASEMDKYKNYNVLPLGAYING